MKALEKFNVIFLGAGVGLLTLAFLTLGLLPALMTKDINPPDYNPTEIPDEWRPYYVLPSGAVTNILFPQQVPAGAKPVFASTEDYKKAVYRGRDLYIREACWHCHSQQVRPVGNEALRYGPVSTAEEYQDTLNLPQLFGTRRVGPDLIREYGKHSTDWQFVHLYNPRDVVPMSVMPGYPWYFTSDRSPKSDAVALVAYVQRLGSWVGDRSANIYETRQ